jgi:cyclomaltodextrin glucanotransferase
MREFRDRTIYFILTDRFYDGEPENNMGKNDELFDPDRKNWYKYWGGDLQGIIMKLDYLNGMGINSVWITPVFDQIDYAISDQGHIMTGYHGYWARDFKRIDEHLVELEGDKRVFSSDDTVFDRLVREMHALDIALVLDVVCNHSNPHLAGGRGELYDDGTVIADYSDDMSGWYHHYGNVQNWSDMRQVQRGDLCDLSDFNEESIDFRNYIKTAIRMWLSKGVDALRVDTVKHMPLWFWQEFTGDILSFKPNLFIFGEWFMGGAYDDASVEFANKSGMSILDFSLQQAIDRVLAFDDYEGFHHIANVIAMDGKFKSATELVTFVDNHDMPRFLSKRNDPERLRMAVAFIMTARGIPCIYYGTEQELHDDTNWGNDPYNRPMMEKWDNETRIFQDTRRLSRLRRLNPAVQKGSMITRFLTRNIYVFSRDYMGNTCLVAMNKGGTETIEVPNLTLPDGTYQDLLGGKSLTVVEGKARLSLPPNSVAVFSHLAAPVTGRTVVTLQVNGFSTVYGEDIYVTGDCPELGQWDIARARRLDFINSNTWCADIPFDESTGKFIRYKYFVKSGEDLKRESGTGHHRLLPIEGSVIWKDDWAY